ncbi:MFS transporter [Paenarthrobacter sp. AMU7]|uniref:MFS transporter n=1 Tax=Paenarthrobacter sp. AMU7 TaxID=3162492 RepID=A0AB39YMT8_9MICC
MNFALYKELLAVKPVRRLLIVGMVSRIPHSAAYLLLTLHIVLSLDEGYAAAGAAAAVMTIGIALGAPWRGRRVDTVGLRKALMPSVTAEIVIWAIVPHVEYQWILPLVFVAGLLTLPIFTVMRQSMGALLEADQRRTGFALDSIGSELVFMIGPAVGAVVAAAGFSAAGLTAVGISASLAGLLLMWFNPPTRSTHAAEEGLRAAEPAFATSATGHYPEAAEHGSHSATYGPRGTSESSGFRSRIRRNFTWLSPQVGAIFAVAAGAGIIMSGTDVGIVALVERGGQQTDIGIVFAFWCGASLIGGLAYGAMHQSISPVLLLLAMAALTIPMACARDAWSLAFLSVPSGLLCAPVMTAASEKVAELVDENRRGEAMGWYGSALTAGVAVGAPLTGLFIDSMDPWSGFVAAGAIGVTVSLLGLALDRGRTTAPSKTLPS